MDYNYTERLKEHYCNIWDNTPTVHRFGKGPIKELPSEFEILSFKPKDSRNMWTYATCGMSMYTDKNPLELHIFSPEENDSLVELLTAVAHYHRTGAALGLGHTVNFGQPWYGKSRCEYGLISLPYLDGPPLELLDVNGIMVRFLWLIPITREEMEYKKKNGLEALEEKMDDQCFNYLDVNRKSLV